MMKEQFPIIKQICCASSNGTVVLFLLDEYGQVWERRDSNKPKLIEA